MEEPTKVCRRDQNPLDREGYRLFFEESLVGAALLSPDGLIREANGTLEELLDCPAGDLTGRHVREFSPPEDQVPGGEG
ncbi:PAS domain-containing protein, partial [Aminomonas paucivorans]